MLYFSVLGLQPWSRIVVLSYLSRLILPIPHPFSLGVNLLISINKIMLDNDDLSNVCLEGLVLFNTRSFMNVPIDISLSGLHNK